MLRLFLAFGLVWLGAAGVRAQTSPTTTPTSSDAYWNVTPIPTAAGGVQTILVPSSTVLTSAAPSLNEVIIRQTGNDNGATMAVLSGSQNRLETNQSGGANAAATYLSGSNNSILLNQTGGSNAVNIGLNGSSNRFIISQDGGDRADLQGLQNDNTRLELVQKSGNNTFATDSANLLKDPTSSGIANLRIEQSGGATVRIQQGRLIGGLQP